MAVNGYWEDQQVILTNSHCTDQQGVSNDGTDFYQHQNLGSFYKIGDEVYDPSYDIGPLGTCPSGSKCRNADVAVAAHSYSNNWDFGTIARTTYVGTYSGSKVIDSSNPRFYIIGERTYPVANQTVDKMGATTGWAYGRISQTCYNWGYTKGGISWKF